MSCAVGPGGRQREGTVLPYGDTAPASAVEGAGLQQDEGAVQKSCGQLTQGGGQNTGGSQLHGGLSLPHDPERIA